MRDDDNSQISHSHWHTIRPWSNRFILTIREITSVSTTFILSSAFSSGNDVDVIDSTNDDDGALRNSFGLRDDSDDEDGNNINSHDNDNEHEHEDEDEDEDYHRGNDDEPNHNTSNLNINSSASSQPPGRNTTHLLSETLNKGLSVTVNATPWKRVLLHVRDADDSATIILYGLMPGRQYDIELGIMCPGVDGDDGVSGGGERQVLRSRMVTPALPRPDQTYTQQEDQNGDITDVTNGTHIASLTPPRAPTIEERATQLRHQLSQLSSERDALNLELKNARRDAQKADAALKTETDVLKRAAEKYVPAEQRARQKVLALQEAVKQTLAAATETDALVRELEVQLPLLKEQESEIEKRHDEVKKEAEKSLEEYEDVRREEKRIVMEVQNEASGLGNRLEKLGGKRERLVSEVIPELEKKLEELRREIEVVEMDADGYDLDMDGVEDVDLTGVEGNGENRRQQEQQHNGPRQPAPIGSQRPTILHNHQDSGVHSTTRRNQTIPHQQQHHHHHHSASMRSPISPTGTGTTYFSSRVPPSLYSSSSDPPPRFAHQQRSSGLVSVSGSVYIHPNTENQPNSASSNSTSSTNGNNNNNNNNSNSRDSQSQSSSSGSAGSNSSASPYIPTSSHSSPSPYTSSFPNNSNSKYSQHQHQHQHQHQQRIRHSPPSHANTMDDNKSSLTSKITNTNTSLNSIFIVDPARGPNGGVRPISPSPSLSPGPGLNHNHSPGPVRQTSLPVNMPSYITTSNKGSSVVNSSVGGVGSGHSRYWSTTDGL